MPNDTYLYVDDGSGPFFRSLSRDVAMTTNFMAKFGYMGSFRNRLLYRQSDLKLFTGNILSTFFANLMKIDPVTPEITMVTNELFGLDGKICISHRISHNLNNYFTNLHQRFSDMYGDYKTDISFAVFQGMLLW